MRKKRISLSTIILALILLVGISVMLYPTVSDWWNSKVQSYAIANYDQKVEELDDSQYDSILSQAHWYNDCLTDVYDPFSSVDAVPAYNDILNISKVESGKIDLFIEHFPLAELLVEVQAAINSLAQANEDAFAIEDQTEALLLHSDHAKLRQILINLLGNAVKFTRGGKVTLRIELISGQQAEMPSTWPSLEGKAQVISYIPFSPHNQVVSFMVADTGIGMTPEQSAKIFEEFTQADGSISRTYGGTGLGLALVRYFSQLLYGRLELLTQAEKGSLFVLKIPLRWPVSEEQPSSPPPLPLTKSAPDAQP